ncbi:MAG TPA: MBL fold metallo-hydrolase [Pirellulales bacterium]|nr:MBL fold metallo-hydrolase [Pirellulales bacterium]
MNVCGATNRTGIVAVVLCVIAAAGAHASEKSALAPRPALHLVTEAWPDVFSYADTCNVYVLRDGKSAILFNLGDGGVLDHLAEIGVTEVDWIVFTDHHREQCQGIHRIDRAQTKLAAPMDEQALFDTPHDFRKWRPSLGDAHTVHGASYVRPPAESIKLDRLFVDGEVFEWHGRHITCLATPGHSPGGMSYLLREGDRTSAFIGGIMYDGARLTNWFDTEWDYGFGKGLDALIASVVRLAAEHPSWAFPTQGPPIQDATAQLRDYHEKLVAFRPDYLRGYPVLNLTKRTKVDPIIKPTPIPQIVQVTPHLYKFGDTLAGKNFAIIISDGGRGLLLDCGLFAEQMLHDLIGEMQKHLGLKGIDALWINHMHGDHFTLGAELKRRFGVKIWTLDRIVDKVENPLRYDYCALITSYNPAYEGLKVDRPLHDGEIVDWEGLRLHFDWMPGQTEFGNCLWLELDGKRIAFTGDNLFGDPSDPEQNGHEAVVARNSAIFEEGYLLGSAYLRDLNPDIIMGAHNVLMTNPAAFIERYHEWSKRIIADYKRLIPDDDYEYGFDPFWVSAYPYRVDLQEHRSQEVAITVRNFRDRPQHHHVRFKLPAGITSEPEVLVGDLEPKSRQTFKVGLTVDPARVPAGVQIVPMDITLDGTRKGELFDFLLQVTPPTE